MADDRRRRQAEEGGDAESEQVLRSVDEARNQVRRGSRVIPFGTRVESVGDSWERVVRQGELTDPT